jgi:hypothetical protein
MQQGATFEKAQELMSLNVAGAYVGGQTPVYLESLENGPPTGGL